MHERRVAVIPGGPVPQQLEPVHINVRNAPTGQLGPQFRGGTPRAVGGPGRSARVGQPLFQQAMVEDRVVIDREAGLEHLGITHRQHTTARGQPLVQFDQLGRCQAGDRLGRVRELHQVRVVPPQGAHIQHQAVQPKHSGEDRQQAPRQLRQARQIHQGHSGPAPRFEQHHRAPSRQQRPHWQQRDPKAIQPMRERPDRGEQPQQVSRQPPRHLPLGRGEQRHGQQGSHRRGHPVVPPQNVDGQIPHAGQRELAGRMGGSPPAIQLGVPIGPAKHRPPQGIHRVPRLPQVLQQPRTSHRRDSHTKPPPGPHQLRERSDA